LAQLFPLFFAQVDGDYLTDSDNIPELPFAAWEPHAWARANYASRMQWLLTLARFGACVCMRVLHSGICMILKLIFCDLILSNSDRIGSHFVLTKKRFLALYL
jgi:hypothetical protein